MNFIGSSLRNKLFVITGTGSALLLGAALYGLLTTWTEAHALSVLLSKFGTEHLHTAQESIGRVEDGIRLSLVMMAGAIVIAFVWFTYVVQHAIVRPAKALVDDLDRLASGDFSVPVVVRTRDEFGRIAGSAARLQTQVGHLIAALRSTAEEVGEGVRAMRDVAEQTDTELTRQDSETEQVAAAMNQMVATSQEVSRHSAETAQATRDAQKLSEEGALASTNALGGIDGLGRSVREAADVIQRVDSHAENIGKILEVISQITEQTNLLALNAAIEAARAGEQGRGFAVVAEEVRSLATRTQSSTAQIQEMIDHLQGGAREAVDVMGRVRDEASSTEGQVETAAVSLAEIAEAVRRIDVMSEQIATASEEQSAVANEVNKNLSSIAEESRHAREYASGAAERSRQIDTLMNEVSALVQQFHM